MRRLRVEESDIRELFSRSRGPGGQNVNKTSTCVHLVHEPTGIEVRCQESRYQARNRARARERLLDKIEALQKELQETAKAEREKTRRRTRPRPAKVKRRILESKAHRSGIKSMRQSIRPQARSGD